MPLDAYVPNPACVMQIVPDDQARGVTAPVWDEFRAAITKEEGHEVCVGRSLGGPLPFPSWRDGEATSFCGQSG